MITDSQIAAKLGMPRQKVRYYRTRPNTTKSRRCATEVAIEQAKEELKQEIINSLTNGKDERTGSAANHVAQADAA